MFKMDLILKNLMAQIYLTSYLLRGKWSTVALPRIEANPIKRVLAHVYHEDQTIYW